MTNLSSRVQAASRDPEPALTELLNDSVLQWLLVSDRIDRAELETVIRCAQWRLGLRAQSQTPLECCA